MQVFCDLCLHRMDTSLWRWLAMKTPKEKISTQKMAKGEHRKNNIDGKNVDVKNTEILKPPLKGLKWGVTWEKCAWKHRCTRSSSTSLSPSPSFLEFDTWKFSIFFTSTFFPSILFVRCSPFDIFCVDIFSFGVFIAYRGDELQGAACWANQAKPFQWRPFTWTSLIRLK